MKRRLSVLVLALSGLFGCGFFDDPVPDDVRLRIEGPAGSRVKVGLATNFVAGVNELGVTQLQVFSLDTLTLALPVDTVVNISVQRRLFVQLAPADVESLGVAVRIDVDEDPRYNQQGNILAADPFRWVFAFNQRTTLLIELI